MNALSIFIHNIVWIITFTLTALWYALKSSVVALGYGVYVLSGVCALVIGLIAWMRTLYLIICAYVWVVVYIAKALYHIVRLMCVVIFAIAYIIAQIIMLVGRLVVAIWNR